LRGRSKSGPSTSHCSSLINIPFLSIPHAAFRVFGQPLAKSFLNVRRLLSSFSRVRLPGRLSSLCARGKARFRLESPGTLGRAKRDFLSVTPCRRFGECAVQLGTATRVWSPLSKTRFAACGPVVTSREDCANAGRRSLCSAIRRPRTTCWYPDFRQQQSLSAAA
jgi:hypothetical protein